MFSQLEECDYNEDFYILSKASKILRRQIFLQKNEFNGTFPPNCQVASVPPMLLAFMQMLVDGPSIIKQIDPEKPAKVSSVGSTAALSLSQLALFNTVKNRSSDPEAVPRHIKDRETPLAIYLAIKVHASTRSKLLVMCFTRMDSPYHMIGFTQYQQIWPIQ